MAILNSASDRRRLNASTVLLSVLVLFGLVAPLAILTAQTTAEIRADRLDFRLAVHRGGDQPAVSQADADRLITELTQHGPDTLEKQHTAVAWFPLDDNTAKAGRTMPIAGQWKHRWYLLASTDPKHTMLADEGGKRAWGFARTYVTKDAMDKPAVGFDFDQAGAERFGALTGAHIGGLLAVLVDGQVVSVANINSVISSSAIIPSSEMTEKDVADLVARLQRGMPAVTGPAPKPTGWEGFKPEVEVTVPVVWGDSKTPQLRLTDGKLVVPPADAAKGQGIEDWYGWVKSERIDLMAANDDTFQGLMGYDMAVAPIGRNLHPGMKWADAMQSFRQIMKPGTPALMSAAGQLPTHYVIQTRDGTMGILTIVELVDKPRGVKIRYRLLADKPAVQPSTAPAAASIPPS